MAYLTTLTTAQLTASEFLLSLAEEPHTRFALRGNELIVDRKLNGTTETETTIETSGSSRLAISAESLNVEKLAFLADALASQADITSFSFKYATDDNSRFCVIAHVNVHQEKSFNALLEQIATRLQIELSWLNNVPSLSKPGLLLMDMDSTVIAVECIDEIAVLAGVGAEVSEVTELAMQGKLDFAQSLTSRVACLKGADDKILQQVRDALPLMPGITRLLSVLKQNGWKVAIASGGFTFFADYLKKRLGLDAARANVLEITDGKLTGAVIGGIVDAQVKADTLRELAAVYGIAPEQTIAMGDGANDLVMMEAAGLGVAYHAKPLVREKADTSIRFSGLDTMLWYLED